MRKEDLILTFNVAKKDLESMTKFFGESEVKPDPVRLKGVTPDLIIIGVSTKTTALEKLLKKLDTHFLGTIKYVYFKTKKFEDLKCLAGRSDVKLLEYPFKDSQLKNIIQDSLARRVKTQSLVEFLSHSIKFKKISDYSDHITSYTRSIAGVKAVDCIVTRGQSVQECPIKDCSKKLKLVLESFDPREKVVGTYKIHSESSINSALVPIYKNAKTLIILKIDYKGDLKEILNKYFFNYLKNVYFYQSNKEKASSFKNLSMIDEVTGLLNQRMLIKDLKEAVDTHKKIKQSFSIMFIDIDFFKVVNDHWGHLVGSQMLVQIGNELTRILRDGDKIYRYGGDEFVVLLPGVEKQVLYKVANRVLDSVKKHKFDVPDGEHNLSVSIGLGEYPTDAKSAKEILEFADEMMYLSKESGRGKVFHIKEV